MNVPRLTAISATLALALALILGAAPPAMAREGDSAQTRCIREAAAAGLVGEDLNPGKATFIGGTDGRDVFSDNFTTRATAGRDVFCGFGGNDYVEELEAGDVFLGGDGYDTVRHQVGGTFNGGAGNDYIDALDGGTFDGGAGNDFVVDLYGGTFNGDAGDDSVQERQYGGTFNGGAGNDYVFNLVDGTFNGGEGYDTVNNQYGGTFNQD